MVNVQSGETVFSQKNVTQKSYISKLWAVGVVGKFSNSSFFIVFVLLCFFVCNFEF